MMKLKIRLSLLAMLALIVCQSVYGKKKDDFFKKIKTERVTSDQSIEWKNFGPGMSGYNEEFWCHPTDPNTMLMGPDMHVTFGTWDNGKSWHTVKDSDGSGQFMKRVHDIEFSRQNPDFGIALDWHGWVFETNDRGRSWQKLAVLGRTPEQSGKDKWWSQQLGMRLSELAVDPTDDNIWYAGAGDFWNVKENHKSANQPHGNVYKYADYGYIKKSTDKGKTWTKYNKGLPENTDVAKIIINPNNTNHLIMATNVGLMTSMNGGKSWAKKSKGLPNDLPRDLTSFYDPDTKEFVLYLVDQTVYEEEGQTTTARGGVFISVDAGATWKDITSDLYFDLKAMNSFAETDRYYRTIGYWFGLNKKEAKSKYSEVPNKTLPVFNRIAVNPLDKNEIYVTFNKKHDMTFGAGDVWRTLDGGSTWISCARNGQYWEKGQNVDYWKKRNNPVEPNIQFAHLHKHMAHEPARSGNRTLEINAKGHVYIGIDQQTLLSTDKGNTWNQVDDYETSPGSGKWIGRGDSDLPGRFMLMETGIKGRRLLCSGEHGLWQTTDLESWPDKQAVAVEQIEGQVHKKGAHSISTVAVHPKDPNTIFFLSWRQSHRGKLRKTTDGGKTWENIATIFDVKSPLHRGLAAQNSLTIDPQNPDNMYFCSTHQMISEVGGGKGPKLTKGGYGFYRSFDGGYTWELSNKGFHDKFSIRRIILDPDNPKVIYAASNDNNGGLYKSTDKGTSWKKMTIPSVIKSVNNVFIDRNTKDIFISTGRRMGTYEEGGVWSSSDKGKTWKKIFKAPYVWQIETSPINPDILVVSVAGQQISKIGEFLNPGLYLSMDRGTTWTKINKGLGQPDKIVDVKPDPYNEDVLWCASWGCGWYIAYLNGSKEPWLKE
ncbi:VPS10 domain-containing protein [Reichenbachiella versicolor]|uniref:VPS10 domain-containing protein n=1 Tax=Reichenbachiella versicolor TaxID=1821036 RepID=UPI001FE4D9EC|nr:hypothetical protein [Reichenbachiella versicolor]